MVTILTRKQIKLLIVVCLVLVLGIVGFLSALPQSQPTNLECFDNTLGVVCWELIGTTDRVHRGSPIDAIVNKNIVTMVRDNIPEIPDNAEVTLLVGNVLFTKDISIKAIWKKTVEDIAGD